MFIFSSMSRPQSARYRTVQTTVSDIRDRLADAREIALGRVPVDSDTFPIFPMGDIAKLVDLVFEGSTEPKPTNAVRVCVNALTWRTLPKQASPEIRSLVAATYALDRALQEPIAQAYIAMRREEIAVSEIERKRYDAWIVIPDLHKEYAKLLKQAGKLAPVDLPDLNEMETDNLLALRDDLQTKVTDLRMSIDKAVRAEDTRLRLHELFPGLSRLG